MPRNTRRRTSKPVPSRPTFPAPQSVKVEGPGVADSIKTGVGFGLGSAMAHSAFDSMFGKNTTGGIQVQNPSEAQSQNQSKDMCAPLFIKYIDCVNDNDKYHPMCMEIHDFMKSYGCVKTQPNI